MILPKPKNPMSKRDNYYQFHLYLLDENLHQIKSHAEAMAAFKIGRKIAKDSYKEAKDDLEETIERGCEQLDIPFTEARVEDYTAAQNKVDELTDTHGASPECRVRADIFQDAFKAKPSIKENHFRVFAAMTAIIGGAAFQPISRDRLHAAACGWKKAELPEGWEVRLPHNSLQKVTKKIAERGFCCSHYDNQGRRHTYYSINKSPGQLGELVNAYLKAKAENKRLRVSSLNDATDIKPPMLPEGAERKKADVILEPHVSTRDKVHPAVKAYAEKMVRTLFVKLEPAKINVLWEGFWDKAKDGSFGNSNADMRIEISEMFKDYNRRFPKPKTQVIEEDDDFEECEPFDDCENIRSRRADTEEQRRDNAALCGGY